MAEEFLKYTIIFDKQTGAIKEVQSDLDQVNTMTGTLIPEAAGRSTDAFDKIGHSIQRMALHTILLAGLNTALQSSEAFQSLESAVAGTAESLVKDLAPGLDLMSSGLQGILKYIEGMGALLSPLINLAVNFVRSFLDEVTGVVSVVVNLLQGNLRGAAAAAKDAFKEMGDEFKNTGKDFSEAWSKAIADFEEGTKRASGVSLQMTKEQATILNDMANAQIEHNTKMRSIAEQSQQEQLKDDTLTYDKKIALRDHMLSDELKDLEDAEKLKQDALKASYDARVIDQAMYEEKSKIATQKYNDEILALNAKADLDEDAIDKKENARIDADAKKKKDEQDKGQKELETTLEKNEKTVADAMVSRAKQTSDVASIVKAGAAAEVEALASDAAQFIEIQSAKAAVSALVADPTPVGWITAAGILAFGTALAATIGVAGNALGGSIDTGAGSSGAGTTGSTGSNPSNPTYTAPTDTGTGAATSNAPPTNAAPTFVIQVSGADMLDNERTARKIAEQIQLIQNS